MSLSVQNLRAVGTGVEPGSLLPGQIAFNVTDKVLYVGDGSDFKTSFDGTQAPGVTGGGWYSMPMDFESLADYYVPNPQFYGDTPVDQQVLTWSTALNHPIWTSNGGTGGHQVHVVTNAEVAIAPGATTSDKITAAIGVSIPSPDEGDVCIVTGLPDDVYEGLYFYTTEWVKGAAYAYPSAAEVIYDNTGRTLGATVQAAIDDLDDGLIATTAIANTANSTANSALSIASAALPRTGGTMTGTIVSQNINVQSGFGVQFNSGLNGTINGINDSINATSSTVAASGTAVKTAYDLAAAAVPRSSFVASGDLLVGAGAGTFAPLPAGAADYILASDGTGSLVWVPQSEGDVTTVTGTAPIVVDNTDPQNPIVSVDAATTATQGVVQIDVLGNINVAGGLITVPNASTTVRGAVQLYNALDSSSTTLALTAAQGQALQSQIDTLTLSNSVTLAGGYDAATGLVDGVTSQGTAAGFTDGVAPPAASATTVDHYLICTTAGSIPSAMENGDWLLAVETSPGVYAYQVLGVGARPAVASYTQVGVTQLADGAAVLAGTSDSLAITPQALQDNVLDSVSTANSNQIASSTAVKTAYDAAVAAQTTANAALPKAGGTMTGNITFQDAGEGVVFNGGSSIHAISDSVSTTSATTAASSTAAKSAYDAGIQGQTDAAAAQSTADQAVLDAAAAQSTADQAVLDAAAAQATANAAIPCASFLAKGDILGGTAAGTYSALAVGTNGQFLSANSACGAGLEWCTLSLACVPCSAYTAVGTILAGNGAGTYCSLPIGTNGQVLIPNTACAAGVEWVTRSALDLCGTTSIASPFRTLLGFCAGGALASGTNNTAVGYCSLATAANNDNMTAVGYQALRATTGTGNTALGSSSGQTLTSGSSNVFIGHSSANGVTTVSQSVAVGAASLASSTTSAANGTVAVGYGALGALTTGCGNVGVGLRALDSVTTGSGNTAVGLCAGESISGATSGNTLIGCTAGQNLTTGAQNTLVGNAVGNAITTGGCNTIVGNYTGTTTLASNVILADGAGNRRFQANGSGAWSYNGTDFGTAGQVLASQGSAATPIWCTLSLACIPCSAFTTAGQLLVGTGTSTFTALPVGINGQVLVPNSSCAAGVEWITVGALCLQGYTCTATPFNTALGGNAGDSITSGTRNTTIGQNAGTAITTGGSNTVIGNETGTAITTGSNNTLVGVSAGTTVSTGNSVTAMGWEAGGFLTGSEWVAIGNRALKGAPGSTGSQNVAVGSNAGLSITTGTANTLIGQSAGDTLTTATNNVVVGAGALGGAGAASSQNVAIGAGAIGAGTATNGNTVAVGYNALAALTTGGGNTAVGTLAGTSLTSGGANTFVGNSAGDAVTSGGNNIAMGCGALGTATTSSGNSALGSGALASVTGACNTAVGYNAGCAITSGACNTLIGGYVGTTTLSNNVVLSDGAGNIKLQVNENGAVGVGTTPSYGTAGQVLKSGGSAATPAWSSAIYGAFSSNQIQTNAGGASGNAVTLNTTASSNGVTIGSSTQVTASVAGVYNIQISLQFEKTDAGTDSVEVWFKKNGTDIANSNTNIQLDGNGAKQLFALNLIEAMTAGQYLEVWWYSADANVQLTAVAAGTRPAIPSAIVTLVPVGA